jgi:hypothetical protein
MSQKKFSCRILSGLIPGFLIACLVMAALPLCSAEIASTDSVGDTGTTNYLSPSVTGDRSWSFEVDASAFKPDEYLVTVSAVSETATDSALFNVFETSARNSDRGAPQQTPDGSSQPATPGYYIRINPVGNHYVGEKFTITGRTNLPEGADMLVQVTSSSFKPTQKSQSGEFSGKSQTIRVSSSGFGASAASVTSVADGSRPPAALAPLAKDSDAVGTDTKIIKTGTVTLEVGNVTDTAGVLQDLVIAQGGYLSTSTIKADGNRRSGTVVLRVPQARFETTMSGIKSAGAVKFVSTQGEDVTEEYVDLQAQKESYEIQLAQYYVLMKKASKIGDILAIQQQIDRVQTELNRLEGRLKYLNSRIDLSTITITLQEPEPVQVPADSGHNFTSVINRGIDGLYGIVDTLIITIIMLLPFLVAGGIGFGIYRWRKAKRPVKTAIEEDLKE